MSGFLAIVAGIAVAATVLACWPLLRERRLASATTSVIGAAALGLVVYTQTSNYDRTKPDRQPTVAEQLAELRRLAERQPDDCASWRRLGSGLLRAGDSAGAVSAYQTAFANCDTSDANLLLDYAEALAENDTSAIAGEAGHLIENALKLDPNNLRAMWYGGSVAAARGDRDLAAQRFESMLRPDTPPQVREILETNIRMLRGEVAPTAAPVGDDDGASISVDVRVAAALGDLPPRATFFLIATTAEGGAPLGVVRRPVSAIPGSVTIGDANAMIPGRTISSRDAIRLIARVSLTGQPTAQPGDWYGELDLDVATTQQVAITIDQIVR